jgi:hypothetical protein
MTAGARRSLRVTRTRRWRSAGRMPCSHGAERQADGGSEANLASLHTVARSDDSVAQSVACHMTAGAGRSLRVTRRWRSTRCAPCSHGAGCQANGGSEATMASLHTVCRQRSAERGPHMTAGARRSLRVTRLWRSAGRMPCLHGAGRQADGGSEATSASLHTVCRLRSAERGQPHDGRRKAVNAYDTPRAKRGAHALLAWGRAAGRLCQCSHYGITAHGLMPA